MKRIAAALSALMLLVTMCMMSGCAQQASNPADVTQNDAISFTEVSSISGSEDLVGKTIGVQLGTTGCTMAEDIENATIDKYSKAADAIEALRQGKVDAVIIDSAPAKYFVEKNPDLSILPEPFAVEEYAMAVKKGNSDLTAQLNSALDQLRENGTLDEINQNWLVDEEYGKHPYTSPEGTTYDGKLVMATNAEFAPYEFKEEGEIVGFDVDMMRAVCDIIGKELVIDDMAFDSIIAAVDSGKADVGVAGMSVTEDRLKNVDFTQSYSEANQAIVIKGISNNLAGKTIGVQIGTTGMTYAEEVPDATVEKYNKGADAVEALKQGKVDVVLIDSAPAKYFVAKNPGLSILSEPFAVEEYAIAIKKGNDELTQQVNNALAQLRENGTLDLINQNWLVDEEYGKHPYTSPENVTRDGKLVMATNAEFAPYEFKEEGEIVGFDVDMMRAVCDILGKELVIDDMAFDSVIAAVDSGKADVGVAGMTVTEDRLKNVNFSDSYAEANQMIIIKGESNDLTGKTIGVQLGTTGMTYAEQVPGATVEKYNKGADAVEALKQNKVDVVLIDSAPAKYFVGKNSDLKILPEPFAVEEYAIAVKKGNDDLTNQINAALKQLRENGTLDQINQNWLVDEEYGKHPYTSPENVTRDGKIVMATNAEFAPYEFLEEGKIVGYDVDMMQAVCDILGKELVIDDMAFDSIIAAVDSGKADVGVAGMTVTEDRLKNVNFTDPYAEANQMIIVKSGDAASQNLIEKIKSTFFEKSRWVYLVKGLGTTLLITVLAVVIGIVLGFIIAIIRSTNQRTGRLKIPNLICRLYLTIVRGTPMVVQLLIIYFVVFSSVNISKIFVAVIAFGLNSAAYVAEIVRSGIMSVDVGQYEAGSSLGFGYARTMVSIILPQALRNILPALGNEAIVLLKETSVSGYIALNDLTKGGDTIRSQTYEAFLPLIAVALIYLIMVVGLSALVNRLERRLSNDKRK